MADVKISELPSLTTPDGSEEIAINDSGSTKNIRIDDLFAGDNVKAKFGAGNDLQIYHDGNNSYITDAGQGNLIVRADQFDLKSADSSAYKIRAITNGAVSLYHNGSTKLATTSTGVDVTGTVTADGIVVDSAKDTTAITIQTPYGTAGEAYSALRWNNSSFAGGDSEIRNVVNGTGSVGSSLEFHTEQTGTGTLTERLKLHNNGDISFYEDTGTTPKFFWDASAENLKLTGIGGFTLDNAQRNGALAITNPSDDLITFTTGTNDDISFVLSGAERLRLSSNGNVGIGTSSPASALDVVGTANSTYLIVGGDDTYSGNGRGLTFTSSASANFNGAVHTISAPSSQGVIALSTHDTERMRIDSSGNVGIGTSSPSALLEVESVTTSGSEDIAKFSRPTYGATLTIGREAGSGVVYSPQNLILSADHTGSQTSSNSNVILKTDGAERMRIDSSGNVLVGKTSVTESNEGCELRADGWLKAIRSDDYVATFRRNDGDGGIVEFLKDGTTVGSIGNSGTRMVIDGAGVSGIHFSSGALLPRNNGAPVNGVIDIGSSTYAPKNLYLSGGVYLGGTGAANKLDDYEEGTWVPTYSPQSGSFGTTSYNLQAGRYVKVGNMVMVTCQLRINTFAVGTASGTVSVTGLPFTAQSESNTGLASVPLNTQQNWSSAPTIGFVNGGGTIISLTRINDAGTDYQFTEVTDMMSGTSVNRLRFSAVYYAV